MIVKPLKRMRPSPAMVVASIALLAPAVPLLRRFVGALKDDNAQREFYLTDVVRHARAAGVPVAAHLAATEEEVQGVNDRAQLAAGDRYRLAAQNGSVTTDSHMDDTTPAGRLIGPERILVETLLPKIGQTTVSRSCHGIFVDSGSRSKESRDEVKGWIGRFRCENHAASSYFLQP